jgi:hypothetical protein
MVAVRSGGMSRCGGGSSGCRRIWCTVTKTGGCGSNVHRATQCGLSSLGVSGRASCPRCTGAAKAGGGRVSGGDGEAGTVGDNNERCTGNDNDYSRLFSSLKAHHYHLYHR